MTSDRVASEAEAWFAQLRGPHSQAERDAFARWRDADPRHAAAYDQAERLWAVAGQVRRAAPAAAPVPFAWRPRRLAALALAASLCVLIGAVVLGLFDRSDGRDGAPSGASRQVAALADGSLVVPSDGARYDVALSATARYVRLDRGRARFVVARDPGREFRVDAGDLVIVARGTIFDIDVTGARTRVDLIEGAIDVASRQGDAPTRTLRLSAGQGATLSRQTGIERADRRAAAIEGALTFTDAPLESVLHLANLGGGVPIALSDPRLGRRRVSGNLDLRDRPALARKLAAALDLRVQTSPTHILLSPSP